jgi:DNA-binding response OmpR family regulator
MSSPQGPPSRRKTSGSRPRVKRVLVVEDDPEPREFLVAELEREGFLVLDAASGQDGLEKVPRFEPDVVVLDLVLPVLSGFALARAVRSLEPSREIGIVAVSGLASEALRKEAIAAGCDVFLSKPVGAAVVVEQVRSLLSRRRSHEA